MTTTDERIDLDHARHVAGVVQELLEPYCERIQIAGSIRRQKPTVKDIEILAVPKVRETFDMLGDVSGWENDLDDQVDWLWRQCIFEKRLNKNGRTTYGPQNKLLVHAPFNVPVDLFSTEARNWGMALLVRTGGAEFNKRVMSRFQQLGMRGHAYGGVTDAAGNDIECPDEETVFKLLGWNYIEPEDRP